MVFIHFVFVCVVIVALAFLFNYISPIVINHDNLLHLSYLILSLIIIIFSSSRVGFVSFIKNITIWIVIIIIVSVMAIFRGNISDIIDDIVSSIIPSIGRVNQDSSVSFTRADNNHFMIKAKANNANIIFLFDTGATTTTLTINDAKYVGIDVDSLKYNIPTYTANGIGFAASAILMTLQIKNIKLENLRILVYRNGLNQSLLGTNFLQKICSYNVSKHKLTLHNNCK